MTWEVHQGDSLRWLTEYRGPAFDAVVTDPPYSSGGMMRGDRSMATRSKYVNSDSASGQLLPDFAGDSRDQRSWTLWSTLWLAEALRVTRPGGILWVFIDWRQLPAMCDAVQAGGWLWRGIVPWNKTEAARPQKGRPRAQCEYCVFATNGPHAASADDVCLPGFFEYSTPRDRMHITEKPVALIQDLLRIVTPGGRVLDPFLGSGSHGEAAVLTGRDFVGCEVVPELATMASARLEAAANGLSMADANAGQIGMFNEEGVTP